MLQVLHMMGHKKNQPFYDIEESNALEVDSYYEPMYASPLSLSEQSLFVARRVSEQNYSNRVLGSKSSLSPGSVA